MNWFWLVTARDLYRKRRERKMRSHKHRWFRFITNNGKLIGIGHTKHTAPDYISVSFSSMAKCLLHVLLNAQCLTTDFITERNDSRKPQLKSIEIDWAAWMTEQIDHVIDAHPILFKWVQSSIFFGNIGTLNSSTFQWLDRSHASSNVYTHVRNKIQGYDFGNRMVCRGIWYVRTVLSISELKRPVVHNSHANPYAFLMKFIKYVDSISIDRCPFWLLFLPCRRPLTTPKTNNLI